MKAKFVNEENFTYLKSKTPEELKKALKAKLSTKDYAKFGDTINKLIDKGCMVSGIFKYEGSEYKVKLTYMRTPKIILHYYQIFEGNNGILRALTTDKANILIDAIKKYGYVDDKNLRFDLSTWCSYLTLEEAKEVLKKL